MRSGIIGTMKEHTAPRIGRAFVLGVGLLFCGCASVPHHLVGWDQDSLSDRDLAEALRQHPLNPNQNISAALLQTTEHTSVHLVQVRVGEVPHIHRFHDMTVFVLRGYGDMAIGKETRTVREGDIVHVPAGVRHYFTNKSSSPSVAVTVFSPPFDNKDTERVE